MGSGIHSIIKSEYERRQKATFDLQQSRKNEVYAINPRFEEIDRKIQMTGLKYSRDLLTGSTTPDEATARISEAVGSLKAEKRQLLTDYGFAADYLDPVYTCPKCRDTGKIESETCSCYRQQQINLIYAQSNLKLGGNETFSDFNPEYFSSTPDEARYGIKNSPRKQILGIREVCLKFVGNFSNASTRNLLFSGTAGVGKTFMAVCTAVELMNKGYTVLYQSAPVLFNTINEYRFRNSKDEDYDSSVYRNILEAELLIIDDLGTEVPSAAKYAELLTILDGRAANDLSRPCKTIISTNIDMRKLYDYYDERVASRIMGSFDPYRFIGEDIRKLKL
ncbi:MAG: ATP-binding protein [Clostridiales bacterium]|nr:ATP-binding protein [Clostridiales bacterium]